MHQPVATSCKRARRIPEVVCTCRFQAKARSIASESIESDRRSSARKWSLSLRLVRPLLAAWRQCHLRSAHRRPAIERGRTRPRSAKLDDDLDRPLMAELSQTTCLLGLLSRALAGRELNGARRLDCVAYPHDRLAARAKSPSKRGHACPRVQLAQHVRPLLV